MSDDALGGLVGDAALAVAGIAVLTIGELGLRRRLPRNPVAGIRLPSTMRSDEAWRAAHLAAGPWLRWTGIATAALAAVDGAGRLLSDDWPDLVLAPAAAGVLLVGAIGSCRPAVRAANDADPRR